MATILDLSLLNFFSPLLVFLFLFALFFALFSWQKLFGEVPSIHAILAVVIAFFGSIFSENMRGFIEYIIPWFVGVMVLVMLVLMVVKMFGLDDDVIEKVVKTPGVYWTIIIVALIITLGGLADVWGEESLRFTQGNTTTVQDDPSTPVDESAMSTSTSDVTTNAANTLYHPKVLGLILIMVVMAIGVKILSGSSVK